MRAQTATLGLAVLSMLLLTGCASIVSGRNEQVSFESEPEGAKVEVDGRTLGRTPLTANLEKDSGQIIKVSKEGYETETMELDTSVNPWFFGNVILGGLPGSTTDAATGSIYEYKQNHYLVTLNEKGTTEGVASDGQKIKKYVLLNFDKLQEASFTEEYTKSEAFLNLVDMLGIDLTNQSAVEQVRATLKEEEEPMAAARAIAERTKHNEEQAKLR
ncbi:PEGA domain-containing protein [Thiohalorhabdus denitrificans]|uniref:PEGA domain-containing protein n=1 Tax=Thiohalorhabdus denitrificans TaxID=381306 RepID=A0A1G5D1M5_9GAMM|nr:PEGA domain-containing protein [Thiohalorhabdus denitrificans]SCY08623.1 PEGA domain-containing protein [Thiohalorhabdus denitrificans]